MNQILYQNRCRCAEEFFVTKKRKLTKRDEKLIRYPKPNEIMSQTFQINYPKNLSSTARSILNSFQNKYIYYAIDDILYFLKENPVEQENLLAILYSPVISLQNNFSVNFFNIWIDQVYIEKASKKNKFLRNDSKISNKSSFITVKLFYKTKLPVKKQEVLW